MTTAESDKVFKAAEHQRERRTVKSVLKLTDEMPAPKAFGNPWTAEKDGKQHFDPNQFPKLMRK